jgi:hypothetical protein
MRILQTNEREERLFNKKSFGAVLLISFVVIFVMAVGVRPSYAQGTKVSVTPASATVGIGAEVVINITVTDMPAPGVYSYQLKLTYNNTVLNATKAEIPADHMLKPSSPSNIFIVDPGTISQADGFVTFALTLLGTEAGKTGSGTLVTVHFQGLAEGNSTVTLSELTLVDPTSSEIPASSYTVVNGTITVQIPTAAPGDVNADGKINIQDMVSAATSFGSKPGDARFNPAADQNKDGKIDIIDFVLVAMYWNQSLKT